MAIEKPDFGDEKTRGVETTGDVARMLLTRLRSCYSLKIVLNVCVKPNAIGVFRHET